MSPQRPSQMHDFRNRMVRPISRTSFLLRNVLSKTRTQVTWSVPCAAGRTDVKHLAVLAHGAPGDGITASWSLLIKEIFVGKGIGLVLFLDNLQQRLLDRFPGNFLAGLP